MSEANLTRSMSRNACSPDNAACEGFFGRLKNELFYPRDWKGTTIEQFIGVVDDYIRWHNEKLIKISWLSQPDRVPGEPGTCGKEPVQVFIRTPSGSLLRGNQQPGTYRSCRPSSTLSGCVVSRDPQGTIPHL